MVAESRLGQRRWASGRFVWAAAAAVPLPAEAPRYRGVLDCVRRVAAAEGVGAFWKGSLAAFLRIGPHQTLTFVIIGWLQRRLRKSTL